MVNIIGVTGIAGSGKDTFAMLIKEMYPSTEVMAFAGPLKDACKILFNLSDKQLHDPIVKEECDERWNKSPRQIFQWLGTDIIRDQIDKNFFITNMKQRIELSHAKWIIVSDIRFPNEAEIIRSLGGKVIKIVRNNAKTTKYSNHITEKGIPIDLVDATIENNASIDEFRNNIILSIRFLFCKI